MDKSGILGSNKGRYGQIRAIKGNMRRVIMSNVRTDLNLT